MLIKPLRLHPTRLTTSKPVRLNFRQEVVLVHQDQGKTTTDEVASDAFPDCMGMLYRPTDYRKATPKETINSGVSGIFNSGANAE
jgi:hypothetical protein